MKLILAVVRPFKVTEIVDAMEREGSFPGMTVLDCSGFGREKTVPHEHVLGEELTDFVERKVIVVAAPDAQAETIARRLERVAHTGRPGDGKIFILPLDGALRIATGERDDAALE